MVLERSSGCETHGPRRIQMTQTRFPKGMLHGAQANEAQLLTRRPKSGIRADIQALRALAVLAVLLYHLWPDRLTGGYVGVDVFFAISGFLITSHLLREFEATGTIRVARFWAARARRLLPASLLVLLLTAIGIIFFVPVGLWERFLTEVSASALYVQNWFLAAQSIDYLGATAEPSPVQHFWTLSVEEQFYFALPLLLLFVALIARVTNGSRRALLFMAISLVTVASLAYSLALTPISSTAYFSTATRAWEFGLGAVVAFLPTVAWRRSLLTAAGVAAILTSVVMFDSNTPFPGIAALLPAGGTALVLWAGRDTFLARLGTISPVAMIGRTSYAIYLWHWPIIVFIPYATGAPTTATQKIMIIVATVALAWLSTRYWEDPMRRSPRLLGSSKPRTVALWSIVGMVVVVAVAGGAIVAQKNVELAHRTAMASEVKAVMSSSCFGAAAMDPDLQPCEVPEVSAFIPSLVGLTDDDANRPECWAANEETEFNVCSLGPSQGYKKHLLVLGDSHANTLIGAYEVIANENDWRIDVGGRGRCHLTTATLEADDENQRDACNRWRADALELVSTESDVDAIIVTRSSSRSAAEPIGAETADTAQINGLVEAWGSRASLRTPIIAIVDNPNVGSAVYTCLQRVGPQHATECGVPRAKALKHDMQLDAVALDPNAHAITLDDFYCGPERCEAVIGGAVVYRPDGNHLTATFARTLAPYIEDQIDLILREQDTQRD